MLHAPRSFLMRPCKCHVCYEDITENEYAVQHSGHGQQSIDPLSGDPEGYVHIWLHPECATVLMLRLANDVMRARQSKPRVVDTLQAVVQQRINHGN